MYFLSVAGYGAVISFGQSGERSGHGEFVDLDVTVSGFVGVGGFQFSLGWDPSVLEYQSVQDFDHGGLNTLTFYGPPMNSNSVNLSMVTSGKLSTLWDHPSHDVSLPDGSRLFSVLFRVVGAVGTETALSLSDDPTSRAFASFTGNHPDFVSQPGSLVVVPEPRQGFVLLSALVGVFALLRRCRNRISASC